MDPLQNQPLFLGSVSAKENTIFSNCTCTTQQTIYYGIEAAQSAVAARKSIWFNMKDPIPSYTGREGKLKEVFEIFIPHPPIHDQTDGIQPIHQVAVTGLGGIGKTEFVRKFAKKYHTEFDNNCVWINAESAQQIEQGFKALADELSIKSAELSGREKILQIIKQVYAYFGDKKSLFIFDNVEEWINGENRVKNYLPQGLNPDSTTPFVLMTSRNRPKGSKDTVKLVELNVLEEQEAIKLIQARLNTKINDLALQLAKLLGCLPLTLQQAISYIDQEAADDISEGSAEEVISHCVKSYIENFEIQTKKFLGYKENTLGVDFDEMKTTLVTWGVTLKKIKKLDSKKRKLWKLFPWKSSPSIDLLKMMSYIAPENIHLKMFETRFHDDDLKSAVSTLFQFSMINRGMNPGIVSVHRLVQRVVRLVNEKNEKQMTRKVFKFLHQTCIELPKEITPYTTSCVVHKLQVWEHLLGHQGLLKKFTKFDIDYELGARHEMHQSTLSLLQKTSAKYKEYRICKESSKRYIRIQGLIGMALLDLHRFEEAKSIFQNIYCIAARELGDSHELTLSILGNCARTEDGLCNFIEAINIYNKLIAALNASPAFGPRHLRTLTSLHNKASCLGEMGNYDEALQLFKSTLAIYEEQYPEDREAINSTKFMIAVVLTNMENYEEAIQLYKETQVERVKSFGESHSKTLICARAIGDCLRKSGKYEDAMEVLNHSLNLAKQNPRAGIECTNIRRSIALVLFDMGSSGEAITELRTVLDELMRIFEDSHPSVLEVRESLADLLVEAGSTDEALQHRQLLRDSLVKKAERREGREKLFNLYTSRNPAIVHTSYSTGAIKMYNSLANNIKKFDLRSHVKDALSKCLSSKNQKISV